MSQLSGQSELFSFSSAVLISTVGFVVYFLFSESKLLQSWFAIRKSGPLDIYLKRMFGVFVYGCLPALFILLSSIENYANFGITQPTRNTYLYTILVAIIILPLNYFNSQKPDSLSVYPKIREHRWDFLTFLLSTLTWITYLFAYEFLLRGYLFFSSLPLWGLWPSIFLNTLIYSTMHVPKGKKETLGAFPFGILLCYLTYLTNSIWCAFFLHVILALSCEWFSIVAQPKKLIKQH